MGTFPNRTGVNVRSVSGYTSSQSLLCFTHILIVLTFNARQKINDTILFTIHAVTNVKSFPRLVAGERSTFNKMLTTQNTAFRTLMGTYRGRSMPRKDRRHKDIPNRPTVSLPHNRWFRHSSLHNFTFMQGYMFFTKYVPKWRIHRVMRDDKRNTGGVSFGLIFKCCSALLAASAVSCFSDARMAVAPGLEHLFART